MKLRSPLANPFYVALLIAAAFFCVTCCAYALWFGGVFDRGGWQNHALVDFLRRHGERVLAVELAIVAALTFASLATDQWWRTRGLPSASHPSSSTPSPAKEES